MSETHYVVDKKTLTAVLAAILCAACWEVDESINTAETIIAEVERRFSGRP